MLKITTGLAVIGGAMMMAVPSFAADASVTLTSTNTFTPADVTINVGEKVTFTWAGGFHDVAFADGQSSGAPVGVAGTTYVRTFATAGTFAYVCNVHAPSMAGTVTVLAAAAATTVPAAATTVPAAATTVPAAATTVPAAATTVPAAGAPTVTTAPRVVPMTGPEDSILPIAGLILVIGGLGFGLLLRLRKAS